MKPLNKEKFEALKELCANIIKMFDNSQHKYLKNGVCTGVFSELTKPYANITIYGIHEAFLVPIVGLCNTYQIKPKIQGLKLYYSIDELLPYITFADAPSTDIYSRKIC